MDFNNIDSRWMFKNILPDNAFFHRLFNYEDIKVIKNSINKIKNYDSLFFVNFEGYTSVLESIYKDFICPHNYPEDKIIVVTSAYNGKELVDKLAVEYNKKPYKVIYFNFWAYWAAEEQKLTTSIEYYNKLNESKSIDKIEKTFLSLNRRWALHRSIWVSLLQHYNLLEKGYVTFNPSHAIQAFQSNKSTYNKNFFKIFADEKFEFDIHDTKNFPKIWDKTLPYIVYKHKNNEIYKSIFQSKAMYTINELRLEGDSPVYSKELSVKYGFNDMISYTHSHSLVNVFTETMYYGEYQSPYNINQYYELAHDNAIVYTEKLWKTIVYRQPFLVVSCPGYLRGLKELGFKTFSNVIDESYDDCNDDSRRMLLIIEELIKLSKLNHTEVESFLNQTKTICEHNFQHYINLNQTFLSSI